MEHTLKKQKLNSCEACASISVPSVQQQARCCVILTTECDESFPPHQNGPQTGRLLGRGGGVGRGGGGAGEACSFLSLCVSSFFFLFSLSCPKLFAWSPPPPPHHTMVGGLARPARRSHTPRPCCLPCLSRPVGRVPRFLFFSGEKKWEEGSGSRAVPRFSLKKTGNRGGRGRGRG